MALRVLAACALLLPIAGCIGEEPAAESAGARIAFEPGADAPAAFALRDGAASFDAPLRAFAGATITYDELARVASADGVAREATLSGPRIAERDVLAYRIDVLDGARVVASLDLAQRDARAVVQVPANRALSLRATITVAEGATIGSFVASLDVVSA